MVEYVVAIDVTRVRFPADAFSLLLSLIRRSLGVTPNKQLCPRVTIRDSIVVSISACHADDPGSIPGRGVFLLGLKSCVGSYP